jgi:hypothetical protein
MVRLTKTDMARVIVIGAATLVTAVTPTAAQIGGKARMTLLSPR